MIESYLFGKEQKFNVEVLHQLFVNNPEEKKQKHNWINLEEFDLEINNCSLVIDCKCAYRKSYFLIKIWSLLFKIL